MNRPHESTHPLHVHPGLWVSLASTVVLTLALAAYTPPGSARPARALDASNLRAALASRPASPPLDEELGFFDARLARDSSDVLALRRLTGAHLLRFRASNDAAELERAGDLTARLAARDPADAGVWATRTSIALSEHRFDDAVQAARTGRGLGDPGDEGGVLRLFDALWAAGEYEEARRLFEGQRFTHRTIGVLTREARLLDGLGETEAARDLMAEVAALVDAYAEPGVVRAWARVELGHFTAHSGDPAGAVDAYLSALEAVPGYPPALEGLGWIAYGTDGDLAAAEALFRRALEGAGHLDILPVLAEIAGAAGRPDDEARLRREFLVAAQADRETERSHLRPLALAMADNPVLLDEALEYANRDLSLRSDRGAWATRGWVLSKMGHHAEAVADAERAVAWGAPEPTVLRHAGEVLLRAGEVRRGRELLRDALEGRAELGPVTAAAIEALLD